MLMRLIAESIMSIKTTITLDGDVVARVKRESKSRGHRSAIPSMISCERN